jgi:hypothetical protein
MREALRDTPPTSFACMVLLGGLFARRRHADSHVRGSLPGWGRPFFSSRLPRTRATKHEAAHAETEAVSEDGRCCMRARCVITEHLADRRKSPVSVVDRGHRYIYWVVQPVYRKGDLRP